jgi:hypothetical protein
MKTTDCARNIAHCALKGLLAELALNRDDDREQLAQESWDEMLADAVENGDEFYDYDGPLTWA